MGLKAQYPFNCIRCAGGTIIASAGSKLYSFSASDGRKLCTWPDNMIGIAGEARENGSAERSEEPPEKRRKLSPTKDEEEDDHAEKQATGKDKASTTTWSSISIIVPTPNGRHVVAVTAEDKHIRVFEIGTEGLLTQLSARPVPKKPCAVTLSSDINTILCADKGGDVYAIPLLIGESSDLQLVSRAKKRYQPTANSLVVHTKRNLESLRQQLRLQEKGVESKSMADPVIKRDVLLGNVSMLTDLAYAQVPSDTSATGLHCYILSADRDEQIRVSRGPPQTHVIEAYCLGHESFISKLCIPSTLPHLLISGGGDDSIFVWNWIKGEVLYKFPIASESEKGQVVVRDIRAMSIANSQSVAIFVILDGSCELYSFLLEPTGNMEPQTSLRVSGNILDLTCMDEHGTLWLSIDCCHEPRSIKNWRTSFDENQILIDGYEISLSEGKLLCAATAIPALVNINKQGTEEILTGADESSWGKTRKSLTENLYSLHNLRKRPTTEHK